MKLYHLALILFMCPLFAEAQKIDETKYLAGAVPQNELGIVVFSQTYEVPGKTKSEIYQALQTYTQNEILKGPNALIQCRFVEQDEANGLLAARVEEDLYFKRKAWVSHKTRFFYELIYTISDGSFQVEMRRIYYLYEDQETPGGTPMKFTAEEWITDKEALTKKGKLLRRTKNFRIGTIDRKNEIFRGAAHAAGAKLKTKIIEVEE